MQARVNHKSGIRNHKLMIALCLVPYALYAPGAGADLASTGYTDAGDVAVLNKIGTRDAQTGNWETTAGDGTTIVGAINAIKAKIGNIPANSSIASQIATKADSNLGDANHAVTTGSTGALQSSALLTGGQIASNTLTNANFAGGLDMGKIDMPTNCTGQCMLVYKTTDQKYVWEELTGGTSGGNGGGTSGGLSADYCVNVDGYDTMDEDLVRSNVRCRDFGATRDHSYCIRVGAGAYDNSNMGSGTWNVDFSYGTIRGQTSCVDNSGTPFVSLAARNDISISAIGNNCWCRISGVATQILPESPWVFIHSYPTSQLGGDALNTCQGHCAFYCAFYFAGYPEFRVAMYNASGITDSGNGACYQ